MITSFSLFSDNFGEFWYLTGDQQNPTVDTVFTVDEIYTVYAGLDDDPADGTIYRFSTSPPNATIDPTVDNQISVFPNPANEYVNVVIDAYSWEDFHVVLVDVSGKNILSKTLNSPVTKIDINNLPQGVYFMHIQTADGMTTKKISKR